MLVAPIAKDPTALTYLTLRKVVGGIAVLLPFALALPWWLHVHVFQSSISDYYYTGLRNLFVGSLCAIAMFLLSCRGFDWQDEVAGAFAALCALGVAFCPTTPACPSSYQKDVGFAHYTFAALLFLTLSYFCLVLFKMTAATRTVTPQKRQRNMVYTVSGLVILASILAIATSKLLYLLFHWSYSILGFGPVFFFETTSLWAFGVAWLVKGETILKDQSHRVQPPLEAVVGVSGLFRSKTGKFFCTISLDAHSLI